MNYRVLYLSPSLVCKKQKQKTNKDREKHTPNEKKKKTIQVGGKRKYI